ncbi:MAG: hypothetical protein WDW36_007356 [Sanguina aurantia]
MDSKDVITTLHPAKRAKRLCVSRKAAVPSATHYVGYVEDEETPEMIMKKFEELERVVAASRHGPVSPSITPCPTPVASSSTAASAQPLARPSLPGTGRSADNGRAPQNTHLPTSPPPQQAGAAHPFPSQPDLCRVHPPGVTAAGASHAAPASAMDGSNSTSHAHGTRDANDSAAGLSEEALLEVFKATSTFSVRAALANNDILRDPNHNHLHHHHHHHHASSSTPRWLQQRRSTLPDSAERPGGWEEGPTHAQHLSRSSVSVSDGTAGDEEEGEDEYMDYLSGFWSDGDAGDSQAHRAQHRSAGPERQRPRAAAAGRLPQSERPPRPPGGGSKRSLGAAHQLAAQHMTRDMQSVIVRRSEAARAKSTIIQLRLPPHPLPSSWGRVVRPYQPSPPDDDDSPPATTAQPPSQQPSSAPPAVDSPPSPPTHPASHPPSPAPDRSPTPTRVPTPSPAPNPPPGTGTAAPTHQPPVSASGLPSITQLTSASVPAGAHGCHHEVPDFGSVSFQQLFGGKTYLAILINPGCLQAQRPSPLTHVSLTRDTAPIPPHAQPSGSVPKPGSPGVGMSMRSNPVTVEMAGLKPDVGACPAVAHTLERPVPAEQGLERQRQQQRQRLLDSQALTLSLSRLPLPSLCPIGFVFVWAQKCDIGAVCKQLCSVGYAYVENLTWVWVAPNNAILTLPHRFTAKSHMTLLIFRRSGEGRSIELRHQRSPDVVFDCVRASEGCLWQVPPQVYATIETMLPTGLGQFLELGAARHKSRAGWDHEDFDVAAEEASHALPATLTNDEKLKIYGLFKQSKEGDVNTGCPMIFDPTGRAKWFAWDSNKGQSKEEAMKKYIDFVNEMKAKHGTRNTPSS